MQKLLKKAALKAQKMSLEYNSALSLSLSAKYNFGQFRQTLNLFAMMFVLFSSPFSVDAQRIRYGYEWPCWETPPPPSFPPPTGSPAPPTLCEKLMPLQGSIIQIGAGSKFTTSSELIATHGTTLFNKSIEVIGDFTIDESIRFYNSRLNMGEKVAIIIDGGFRLESRGSKFFCCKGMWNGIYMNPKSKILLEQNIVRPIRWTKSYKN